MHPTLKSDFHGVRDVTTLYEEKQRKIRSQSHKVLNSSDNPSVLIVVSIVVLEAYMYWNFNFVFTLYAVLPR